MKRLTNLLLSVVATLGAIVVLGAVLMMTACSGADSSTSHACEAFSDGSEAPSEDGAHADKAEDAGGGKSGQRIIACWGDSLTEGVGADYAFVEVDGAPFDASFQSYPEILEKLTGITTINYGVAGATSEDIVFLQGALLKLREIDASEAPPARDSRQRGDVLVLEIGSNGGWDGDYDTLIEQYQTMIDRSGCDNYIIIGDTDDPGMSIVNAGQEASPAGEDGSETEWESALSEAFGEHFINMRVFLVERGLEVAGLEATEEDEDAAAQGCVSEQLRSDWTHLNSYGYFAQAVAVYEKGRELGYW